MSALNKQIGGNHYKNFAIQPIEFTTKNKLGFIQGDVVKRICRYNMEGGKGIQDLEKIKHEIDVLIELEYGNIQEYKKVFDRPCFGTNNFLTCIDGERCPYYNSCKETYDNK